MRVPACLGLALAALVVAAPAWAQATGTEAAAAPSAPPEVVVINPDRGAPSSEAAPPEAKSEPAPSETPAAASPEAGTAQSAPTSEAAAAQPNAAEPPSTPASPAGEPVTEAAAPPPPPPEPTLFINIDLSAQRMTVKQVGGESYHWLISSAAYGYKTPTGTFQPTWMSKMHYSRQYDLAPMPHAIFFSRGSAIHGTHAVRQLGRPASHGCVRLAPGNAAKLFKLVNAHGRAQTKIVVHGKPRYGDREIAEGQRLRYADQRRRYAYDYDAPYYYSRRPPRGFYYESPQRRDRRYNGPSGYAYGF